MELSPKDLARLTGATVALVVRRRGEKVAVLQDGTTIGWFAVPVGRYEVRHCAELDALDRLAEPAP